MKKKEVLLILGIVAAAVLLGIGLMLFKSNDGESIRITVDGKEYGTWKLDEDQTIEIKDTNVCEIKDGKVRMIRATCPDHLCMEQAPVDENGGMIVCLPNKVIIEGTNTAGSGNGGGADAVG